MHNTCVKGRCRGSGDDGGNGEIKPNTILPPRQKIKFTTTDDAVMGNEVTLTYTFYKYRQIYLQHSNIILADKISKC